MRFVILFVPQVGTNLTVCEMLLKIKQIYEFKNKYFHKNLVERNFWNSKDKTKFYFWLYHMLWHLAKQKLADLRIAAPAFFVHMSIFVTSHNNCTESLRNIEGSVCRQSLPWGCHHPPHDALSIFTLGPIVLRTLFRTKALCGGCCPDGRFEPPVSLSRCKISNRSFDPGIETEVSVLNYQCFMQFLYKNSLNMNFVV